MALIALFSHTSTALQLGLLAIAVVLAVVAAVWHFRGAIGEEMAQQAGQPGGQPGGPTGS